MSKKLQNIRIRSPCIQETKQAVVASLWPAMLNFIFRIQRRRSQIQVADWLKVNKEREQSPEMSEQVDSVVSSATRRCKTKPTQRATKNILDNEELNSDDVFSSWNF